MENKYIEKIVTESVPLTDPRAQLAIKYLVNRGLNTDFLPNDLLFNAHVFNKELDTELPCLIGVGKHPVSRNIKCIQRIYLSESGEKAILQENKMYLGAKSGSIIFLDDVGSDINIAEGIETALAVRQTTHLPTISALDSTNMASFIPPKIVKVVRIWEDKDRSEAGEKAAKKLAKSLIENGLTVYIHKIIDEIPEGKKGIDWLDILNLEGAEPFETSLQSTRSTNQLLMDELLEKEGKNKNSANTTSSISQDEKGIYVDSEVGREYISSPIQLLYECRNQDSQNWSKVFQITDPDNVQHKAKLSYEHLSSDPNEIMRILSDNGFRVKNYGRRTTVASFLNNWSSDERKVLTDLTGWHGSTFVTQSYNVGEKKGEFEFYSKELSVQLKEKGTLDEWNAGIARFARGNSRIMICMALSLTGPLLKLHGLQNFGIHLFGPSSCGKSTCSKIAASVWSNPNKPNPFVQTWRATGNALEGMSKAHNELILILDELAEIDPHQLKPTIYMLGNGQTKSRANQNGDAIAKKFFSIVFLSNGEETLEAIASKAGETLKAGQEVRLIEIDADAGLGMGIIQELHDFKNSDSLISEIENNFNQFYGVAGKAFLENISEMKSNDEHALMNTIKCYQNSFDSHLRESSNPQVGRVQNSFSFIAAIGELAIELEILPFNKGEMESAVLEVFNLWKNSRDRTILSDEERALDQVRYFFEVNGDARFSTYNLEENGTASSERSYQKAGFRGEHQGEACWLVFPQVFRKEVCKGHSTKNVARVLKKKGLLLCDNDGAPFISKTIGSKTFRVYAVRERILEK